IGRVDLTVGDPVAAHVAVQVDGADAVEAGVEGVGRADGDGVAVDGDSGAESGLGGLIGGVDLAAGGPVVVVIAGPDQGGAAVGVGGRVARGGTGHDVRAVGGDREAEEVVLVTQVGVPLMEIGLVRPGVVGVANIDQRVPGADCGAEDVGDIRVGSADDRDG